MIETPPNPRCERKFTAPGLSLPEALAMIRRHPAAFRETYPARTVNSVYLDSPALTSYFHHVEGTADRVKTRIRWYGDLAGRIAAPTLERKVKRGSVSGKASYPLRVLSVNGALAPQDLEAALHGAGLPEVLRSALRHLKPVLVNRYRRHYFQSGDGHVRLTADTDLQFLNVNPATGKLTPAAPSAPGVILELKYDPRDADRAAQITNAFPMRLTRCSKYVLGVERLHAN